MVELCYIEYRRYFNMAFGKKIKEMITDVDNNEESYYTADAVTMPQGSGKMILLEPRAFSESQQIADHLKKRNTVVVNMKRVTSEQAKRIIDFLSGTVYAIGGDLQKIGVGIFLCTPKNVNVEGSISDEDNSKRQEDIED
jgi:cell division inhibitor SepF